MVNDARSDFQRKVRNVACYMECEIFGHIVSEFTSEIERKNAQKAAVKAVLQRFLCGGHTTAPL